MKDCQTFVNIAIWWGHSVVKCNRKTPKEIAPDDQRGRSKFQDRQAQNKLDKGKAKIPDA